MPRTMGRKQATEKSRPNGVIVPVVVARAGIYIHHDLTKSKEKENGKEDSGCVAVPNTRKEAADVVFSKPRPLVTAGSDWLYGRNNEFVPDGG